MRPTVPTVKIHLDKERTLRFDFNALAAFEEETGQSALNLEVWRNPNAKTLRALLWSAMLYEDAGVTIKQVGAMLHTGNLAYVSEKIREASEAANPDVKEEEPEPESKNVVLPTG